MPQQPEPSIQADQRSTQEVFEDHLEKRSKGLVEEDIATNYAEDVVVLTGIGTYRGHDGIRQAAANLDHYLPDASFTYTTKRVEDAFAFLEWHGESPKGRVCDGADSFVIRNGRIIAQTIHYTVDKA